MLTTDKALCLDGASFVEVSQQPKVWGPWTRNLVQFGHCVLKDSHDLYIFSMKLVVNNFILQYLDIYQPIQSLPYILTM
jgi:hypothetical protein